MKKKILSTLLATMMAFSSIPVTLSADMMDNSICNYQVATVSESNVRNFVTRLYNVCLDRDPDAAGLNDWTNRLVSKKATGASVAFGFIFSAEFQNKNCTNTEYVRYMYRAFFDREPDSCGADWVNQLNNGLSKESLFAGFANSPEFFNLCSSYGIVGGTYYVGKDRDSVANINLFVERLYNVVLNRNAEMNGLGDWSGKLARHERSGSEIAHGFYFSQEYTDKNKSNSDFVEDLYLGMMGRSSDASGKADWVNKLNSGFSRLYVFNGFVGSTEFTNICNSYGVTRGNTIPGSSYASTPTPTPTNSNNTTTSTPTPTPVTDWDAYAAERGLVKYVLDTRDKGEITVYAEFIDMTELSNMVNDYRVSLGLAPYKVIKDNSYARLRAVEVAYYFSHTRPIPSGHFVNYDVPNMGPANLTTSISPASAYSVLFNSQGHRTKWEDKDYFYIAICCVGVQLYKVNDEGTDFVKMNSTDCMNYNGQHGWGRATAQCFWEVDGAWNITNWDEYVQVYANAGLIVTVPDDATINPNLFNH